MAGSVPTLYMGIKIFSTMLHTRLIDATPILVPNTKLLVGLLFIVAILRLSLLDRGVMALGDEGRYFASWEALASLKMVTFMGFATTFPLRKHVLVMLRSG